MLLFLFGLIAILSYINYNGFVVNFMLKISNLTVMVNDKEILKDFSLEIETGKIVGLIGNKKIKKPIHMLNRNLVGLYYNPKIDHPVKGSILYTLFDFIIYGFLFIFITTIVQLFM